MVWYLWVLIFGGLALALAYQQGRKANLALIRHSSRSLEEVLQPDDRTYTWIGGLVGYHAVYTYRSGPVERVEITVTLLPRHAPLFLPISWLLFRSDRIFLTAFFREPFSGEAHLVRRDHVRKLLDDVSGRDLKAQGGRGNFVFLASADTPARFLRVLSQSVAETEEEAVGNGVGIVHVALVPDRNTLFVFRRAVAQDGARSAALVLRKGWSGLFGSQEGAGGH